MSTNENIEQNRNLFEVVTIRDYFAAKAMQGVMSKQSGTGDQLGDLSNQNFYKVAEASYQIADAMMEARNAPTD